MYLQQNHSRPQSLRSFWPAAGIERLWEQPFQACAIDVDYVRPDGQNSVISFVISKWLLPELSIPAAGQKDRRLWGRECSKTRLDGTTQEQTIIRLLVQVTLWALRQWKGRKYASNNSDVV